MEAVPMVEQTRQLAAETRKRVDHTREMVETSRRVFERNVLLYREAMAIARRRQELLAEIPHGDTFLFMHADCYEVWRAQCHVRALLRPFE
jgi:hypothetical protein